MELKEVIAKCSDLEVQEERSLNDGYVELVFFTKDQDAWSKALAQDLGEPIKPAGVEPSKEQSALTEAYGGVFANQTLFNKDFNGTRILAMFWPWQDKEHTTLKLALLKK